MHANLKAVAMVAMFGVACGSSSPKKSSASPVGPGNSAVDGSGSTANALGTIVAPPQQPAAVLPPPVVPVTTGAGQPAQSANAAAGNPFATLISSLSSLFGGGANAAAGPAVTPVLTNTGTSLDDLRQNCLSAINQYRASIGRSALTLRTDTSTCVDGQAVTDSGFIAHASFGKCGESAQDECPNWDGPLSTAQPKCLSDMWAEGPGGGHYQNMANASYTQVSCGYSQSGNSYTLVQDFF